MTRSADLWQQALSELELLVDRESFATWFSPTKYGGIDNKELIVSVPNSSCKKWLLSNYLDEITAAINKLNHDDLSIEFRVEQYIVS